MRSSIESVLENERSQRYSPFDATPMRVRADNRRRHAPVHPSAALVKDENKRERQYDVPDHLRPASKRREPLDDRNSWRHGVQHGHDLAAATEGTYRPLRPVGEALCFEPAGALVKTEQEADDTPTYMLTARAARTSQEVSEMTYETKVAGLTSEAT